MEKIISVGGREIGFRASALLPKFYRRTVGRDIMVDLNKLQKEFGEAKKEEKDLPIDDLEIFENVAYVMAKLYDRTIPGNPDEWLDTFDTFDIYQIFPQIMELWAATMHTTSKPKNG